jgi:histone deacetylase 11
MNIYYHNKYNIDLGVLNALHPFDGKKFGHVVSQIEKLDSINIVSPANPISHDEINAFVDSLLALLLLKKRYILQALEVHYIPLIPYSFIDKHILLPMRWGVSGTLEASRSALQGNNCWNLSGGYHHASRASSEGFCVYNDIGITVDILTRENVIKENTRILIIDIDAHHGNGNAYVFMEKKNVTILDIYNDSIYPNNRFTKERVDINIPLQQGTQGDIYLNKLSDGLSQLNETFALAFVIAGTDVLRVDPLGGLGLTMDDCVARDKMVLEKLRSLSIPFVVLGGGGYSKDSAKVISKSIAALYQEN